MEVDFQSIFSYITSIVTATLMVVIPLAIGWFVMWKMYLSKYDLIREILGLKKEEKKKKIQWRRRSPLGSGSQGLSTENLLALAAEKKDHEH